jgi:glutaredoxin
MIIKFFTEGCHPCKAISSLLNSLEIDYQEIDIAKDIPSAIKHKVRSVPTVLNTDTGKSLVGFPGIMKAEEWINDNCR